jgi:hypothetical protein
MKLKFKLSIFFKNLIFLFIFYLFFITPLFLNAEASEIKFKLFLNSKTNQRIDDKFFSCTNPVILNFYWSQLAESEHLLEAFWYRPDGKKQETTVHRFNFVKGRAVHTWMNLILKRGNSRSFFFPGDGWGKLIGPWKVNIYLNGNFLAKNAFNVNC